MLVQPYSPHWPRQFADIATALRAGFNVVEVHIEHVGSTAVPGLAAKAIIDIDLIYRKPDFAEIVRCLTDLGYQHRGDQGIADREVFKRNGSTQSHPILDSIAHHLYACSPGSAELKRH